MPEYGKARLLQFSFAKGQKQTILKYTAAYGNGFYMALLPRSHAGCRTKRCQAVMKEPGQVVRVFMSQPFFQNQLKEPV